MEKTPFPTTLDELETYPQQTLTAEATGRSERFEIDAYKKRCLQNGYDDVDYLCSISDQIRRFEATRK